jgi:hypothetical protein
MWIALFHPDVATDTHRFAKPRERHTSLNSTPHAFSMQLLGKAHLDISPEFVIERRSGRTAYIFPVLNIISTHSWDLCANLSGSWV